jgi:hypothetical protein
MVPLLRWQSESWKMMGIPKMVLKNLKITGVEYNTRSERASPGMLRKITGCHYYI